MTSLPTSNSPTTVLSETTNTFRRLFLKSEQASIQYSPTHLLWNIPTSLLTTAETTYRARILNLNLFNCFPSVPRARYIRYYGNDGGIRTISINSQNWNAYTLADFLTTTFKDTPTLNGEVTVTYDIYTNRFTFSPGLPVVHTDTLAFTDAWKELGIKEGSYTSIGYSNTEVDLSGVTKIQVESSWSATNLPITGKLATIPNDTYFTEELQFYEASGDPFLVVNQDITSITIDLQDQFGTSLSEWLPEDETYEYPPWSITILLDTFSEIERQSTL